MSLEQSVEYALASVEPPPPPSPADTPAADARPAPDPLTRRQREVAALIARGLTNQQIAAELVITEGTAANHVEHILTKLGFHSRSQIAAWAVERGLHTAAQD